MLSWRGLRSTRASGSGLECLALWASLSCAASVAGPLASHTTAGSIPGDASGGSYKGLSEAEAGESLLQQSLLPQPLSCVFMPSALDHTGFPAGIPSFLLSVKFLAILKAQTKKPSFEPSALHTFSYLILSVSLPVKWE